MKRRFNTRALWMAKFHGADVMPAQIRRFVLFDRDPVSVVISIMANTSNLPGNFHAVRPAADLETVIGDFLGDIQIWPGRADGGQLIAELTVQRFEPVGESNDRFS